MSCICYDSPIGPLGLFAEQGRLTKITFGQVNSCNATKGLQVDHDLFCRATDQLDAYFAAGLTRFDLPIQMQGSPFQQQVWEALRQIPFGQTMSYREVAEQIGNPKAYRAVGLANGMNPLPIVVPCHRVIASDGSLAGFAGGVDAKSWLLDLERSQSGLFAKALS